MVPDEDVGKGKNVMIADDDAGKKPPNNNQAIIIIEEVAKQNKLLSVETVIDPKAFVGVNIVPLEDIQPQDRINPLLGFISDKDGAGPLGVKSACLETMHSLHDQGGRYETRINVDCGGNSSISVSAENSNGSSLKVRSAPPGFSLYTSNASPTLSNQVRQSSSKS